MIRLLHAEKVYGSHIVLHDINLELEEGETYYIKGASGEGKTTFLRLLAGLEPLSNGTMEGLEGKRVSMVFQENRLCENLSASRNIRMVMPDDSLQSLPLIHQYLAELGMENTGAMAVREMSGGMKRRVAILRALLAQSDVLLFDEACTGIDDENRKKVIALIHELGKGKTIFYAAHDETERQLLAADVQLWVHDQTIESENLCH